MAESAYSIVLSNVNTLAIQETTLLCGVTLEVESLKDELKRLQGFLRDADGKRRLRDEDIVVLVSQIRDVGYEADNAIEAVDHMQKRNRLKKGFMGAIARYARLPSDLTTLLNVGVEIERIKRKIYEIVESANRLEIVDLGHVPIENVLKLDEEKSWELLSSKALPSYKRSVIHDVDEFEKLGRKLAKKCDGCLARYLKVWLPLALALLGGYLSKHLNAREWSDILLDWPSTRNGQIVRNIVARSYKDLPNHYLRSCFLYIASYPKDYIIDVPRLVELWIAEGFIPQIPNHKLEETAHKCVAELAQRSLVEVIERSRAHGCIDIIKIHDILHDWCAEEARQDGFLDVRNKTTASVPRLRFLRVLSIEDSTLKDFSTMNQLTTLFLMMFPMPMEVFNLFANMPHLVDITLGQFGVLDKLPHEFPQSVRRLVLYADVIRQDPMPILEKLPCLVVLKLEGYEGKTMSCSAQGFPQLQELELHRFSMEEWRTEEGTMAKLSLLVLWECEKISKLCEGLLDLPYLNHVTLADASQISEE
ncbi:putative disease resistance protein At1g50180 [Triticum dicoccoides]|uniref:putative disease resistance protein At1g50180 n=1 Tax=Triticum dicoccoides TaxID=85692 RepID=UPI001891E292|nr:putative disease resistance protein At1g50180 [Triticum dicoccoides]